MDDRWAFEPTLKVAGLNRTRTLEATLAHCIGIARQIPITRVSDVTPLDTLQLPVFSAVTPLALDLTVHMGKGTTVEGARVSAMMEAIERVCAEEVTGERRRGSFVELAAGDDRAIDPSRFQLPDDTAYDPRREYDWVPGWDLMEGGRVWAPEDLVRTPPQAGILHDVDTNGVASGNCLVEAVVHALCEVIERDALSQRHFLQLFGEVTRTAAPRRLDLLTLPASLLRWVERIEQEGMLLDVLDITSDVGVPTFHALLTAPLGLADMGRGQATTFFGLGTHPTASVALSRAVTEVIQARLGVIQGARDSYNRMSGRQRASARRRMLTRLESGESVDFRTFDEVRNEDLLDDLAFIVAALRRAGIDHAYAFDLSRPGLGVAVVRVRVPGLSQFCLNMRRVGPRCLRHLV